MKYKVIDVYLNEETNTPCYKLEDENGETLACAIPSLDDSAFLKYLCEYPEAFKNLPHLYDVIYSKAVKDYCNARVLVDEKIKEKNK